MSKAPPTVRVESTDSDLLQPPDVSSGGAISKQRKSSDVVMSADSQQHHPPSVRVMSYESSTHSSDSNLSSASSSTTPPITIIHIPDSEPASQSQGASNSCPAYPQEEPSLSGSSADELNHVEVIDDLSVNRWLMRVMRLGGTAKYSGSSGYGQQSLGVQQQQQQAAAARGRRKSAVEGTFLRPPSNSSARGRRFSDSMHLMTSSLSGAGRLSVSGSGGSKSRKGSIWLAWANFCFRDTL